MEILSPLSTGCILPEMYSIAKELISLSKTSKLLSTSKRNNNIKLMCWLLWIIQKNTGLAIWSTISNTECTLMMKHWCRLTCKLKKSITLTTLQLSRTILYAIRLIICQLIKTFKRSICFLRDSFLSWMIKQPSCLSQSWHISKTKALSTWNSGWKQDMR